MKKRKNILKAPIIILSILAAIFIVGAVIACIIASRGVISEQEDNKPGIALPEHGYNFINLHTENEIKSYEDDLHTSMFGIDVSVFQDHIDFAKIKENGVEFVYMRIGYRRAEKGELMADKQFENFYPEAINNGLKVGIYFYSQAINEEEAIEEAQYTLALLNGRKIDLPIVYDYEETYLSDGVSRMADISNEQRTRNAIAFLEEIKKSGHDVMIYANLNWLEDIYIEEDIKEYKIWYAQYDCDYPNITRPFSMWQYSNTGEIEGAEGFVDLDILFIDKEDANE